MSFYSELDHLSLSEAFEGADSGARDGVGKVANGFLSLSAMAEDVGGV